MPTCDRIARQHGNALGWVMRASLERAVDDRTLHVACIDNTVRAFVLYSSPSREPNTGYNVVHTLATERGWNGLGIGRNLLYSVPTPIRLKCPDGLRSNTFYLNAGFSLAGTDNARSGRPLNVYELHVLCVHVQGGNRKMPVVARASGMAYGSRHDYEAFDYAFMVDIHWRDYDWADYMQKITLWRPVMAMVADYETPDQRDTMLAQVADLRHAGVLVIMVCPKFHGAVKDIPADCRVAVSVPSRYAGFMPSPTELRGRTVHLLGGSPIAQRRIITEYAGAGARVISVDGNSHETAAKYGTAFIGHGWTHLDKHHAVDYYGTMVTSGRAIVRTMNHATASKQLHLWEEA